MAEPMTTSESRCPWCSALLPDPAAERCPSCGAQLVSPQGADPQLPGVTTLDAEAILRARSEAGRSRGGVLSFLSGGETPDSGIGSPASLAPPENAVRREMLRMELEAAKADAIAEEVALRARVLAEQGMPLKDLEAAAEAQETETETIMGDAPVPGGVAEQEPPEAPAAPPAPPPPPGAGSEPRPAG